MLAPRRCASTRNGSGPKADELEEILTRVLAVDPAAEWALRRLSVFYTVKERWNDLLAAVRLARWPASTTRPAARAADRSGARRPRTSSATPTAPSAT
jgi:hypothetical protein